MHSKPSRTYRLARLPNIAAVLSIVACYGTLAAVSILGVFGVTLNIHEGAWAGVITLFGWLVPLGMIFNARSSRAIGPLLTASGGAVLITWVMFMTFNRVVEILGFVALLSAIVWDRRLRRAT